jgi:hypothetical protein
MYIIDKNKDYYDYLSSPNIYGTDKRIVFDRRGSKSITDETIANLVYKKLNSYKRNDSFILLEVGFKQYIIELCNIKYNNEISGGVFISCKFKLVQTIENNAPVHLYPEAPMSIREIDLHYRWKLKGVGRGYIYSIGKNTKLGFDNIVSRVYSDTAILNPILKDTKLTKLFTPDEMWGNIQTYLSSLNNDNEQTGTDLTDVERAEIHGFDKITSFRNPIK